MLDRKLKKALPVFAIFIQKFVAKFQNKTLKTEFFKNHNAHNNILLVSHPPINYYCHQIVKLLYPKTESLAFLYIMNLIFRID